MKPLYLVIVITVFFFSLAQAQTFYYSRGSFNINDLNSWRSNRDGTGSLPSNFTNNNQAFVVQNGHSMAASARWEVSGTNSHVRIENGGKITTGAYNHQITGTVYNGGTYEVTHDTYSSLGWGGNGYLENNSNFVLNNSSIAFNDNVSYGNLIVKNGEADCRGNTDGFEVRGTLTVQDNGIWDGGLTEDQTHSIANILIKNNGLFYGSTGSAQVTYNLSGGITIEGGYFLGSEGSGRCTYNVGGNLSIAGGFFYATYRDSGDLPSNQFNIAGSFTRTGGNYRAVNRVDVGYPTFYLTGTGKSFGLGDVSETLYARHFIDVRPGSNYTLSNHIPVSSSMQFYVWGTLNADNYRIFARETGSTFRIYGTLNTTNSNGLSGSSNTCLSSDYSPSISLWDGCTIGYTSNSAQSITARTDYKNLNLSGSGTKTISGPTTIVNALSIESPLNVSANLTSSGSIAVNSPVSISSGTVYINGSMSGTSSITGGNVVIGGSGSQLSLRALNVNNLTLNRSNGSLMYANVTTGNLILTSGNFNIGSYTLEISQALSGSGTLVGGANSNLTISGSASLFTIPAALELHTLTLSRSNGAALAGELTLNSLALTNGALVLGAYTMNLSGTMSWTSGSISTINNSVINLTGTSSDLNLYPISNGAVNLNRSGKTCYLTDTTTIRDLYLTAGTFAIGTYQLTITNSLTAVNGALSGGANATLTLQSGAFDINLPSITLGNYIQNCNLVTALGSLNIENYNQLNGTLALGTNSLTVTGSMYQPLLGEFTASITGSGGSTLYLNPSGSGNLDIYYALDLAGFSFGGSGSCRFMQNSLIANSITLNNGAVNPNGYLTLGDGCTISRALGSFSSAPIFAGNHTVIYYQSLSNGFELSPLQGPLQQVVLAAPGIYVTVTNDVELNSVLRLAPLSTLNLGEFDLDLSELATIISAPGSLLLGRIEQTIGDQGFHSTALGFNLDPGVNIDSFSLEQQAESQTYGSSEGILRTWSIGGVPSGTVSITFAWDASADNHIHFAPHNRAIVYRKVGELWQQVGDPQDVSAMNPRQITVETGQFSEWTVGAEDNTLPVELSSFTATATAEHFVELAWTTQSETQMSGYYIYRAPDDALAGAIRISYFIPAYNSSQTASYNFTDYDVQQNTTYYYWLEAIELNISSQFFGPVSVFISGDNQGEGNPELISKPGIESVYPNPFNLSTIISYTIPEDGYTSLVIYNHKGQAVCTLLSGQQTAGTHNALWNGLSDQGSPCASGVYYLLLHSGKTRDLKKAALLK